ncbi:hypothetical protein Ab1vBOLIVR2_gp55 [Agrobacterium phage OLIVR2]|uniref:Uncharacterized protein n=1 Tax=Agrobacterium phage OLIVR1 TaxID=2723769 RepID=A0A858MU32_9CAUD|nr:hypothetical protein KNU98_gp054 [Agrobacterium phage OLIVR1]QIW87250.1 hypothetical protein Ab1vBOLIVR1_gp55 [Agrobacterium phage OLIVR1]QIW87358.1 hypothetical protein Ab1vBOLIVR2_gp55 [Agrobacterium phage OLIVR2]QIW87465.1 hypothetical protein Ab1vBOLIVR3_gp55 [Agrobacterium phage OLIVR3]
MSRPRKGGYLKFQKSCHPRMETISGLCKTGTYSQNHI